MTATMPEPFSTPEAVTYADLAFPITKNGVTTWRSVRIVSDLDAPMHAVYVRDDKGRLPEKPQYMAPHSGMANHFARHLTPHPDAAAINAKVLADRYPAEPTTPPN